jgi:hypothetical protein
MLKTARPATGGGGVTQIVAGTNVTISPAGGTGIVTINATGGGGSGTVTNVATGAGLTGGPITTTGTISLATSGVTANTYGNATVIPVLTVDTYGRVTSATNVAITAGTVTNVATGTGLTGGPITSTGTISLATSGVTANTYGSATVIPVITVDTYGRITSATNTAGTFGTVTSVAGGTGLTGGTITTSGTLAINTAAPLTWTNTQFFNGSTSNLSTYSTSTGETAVTTSGLTGVINYDISTQSVLYYTSSSGNFGVNIRGSSTTTFNNMVPASSAVTIALMNTNGATAYYLANVSVDGTGQTIKWLNTTVTAGNANAVDAYAITIIKTAANTYTVLASQSQFV